MPAPVLTPSKAQNKATLDKTNGHPRSTKTRIVRRRGRARNTVDSDDEFEREARSSDDSGSEDEKSSLDSDSDDDSVHKPAVTPSTTQSPQPEDKLLPNGTDKNHINGEGPFAKSTTTDWSEMVSEEAAWGSMPVVDFNQLEAVQEQPKTPARAKKPRKDKKNKNRETPEPIQDEQENLDQSSQPVASSSRRGEFVPRGRSAREAYQTRLQADPSYVPTVGEFWGHDDRLLDKDLRSLSGWWRGKWQGGGRGGFRGGRGAAHFSAPRTARNLESENVEVDQLPPIEKAWGHDGFEEMKQREERRRQQTQQERPSPAQRGARGGRGAAPRGRGAFSRGGFNPSSPRSNPAHSDRPWFAMKPERMWTKQLDWFLHSDPSLKPRPGQGQGFRVKLTGSGKEQVIRTPPRSYSFPQPPNPATTTQTDVSHEVEDHPYVVKLPSRSTKENVAALTPVPKAPESQTTKAEAEESLDEVFTVKPTRRDSIAAPAIMNLQSPADVTASQARSELIERAVVKSPQQSSATVHHEGESFSGQTRPSPPVLPPIRTAFSPVAPQPQNINPGYTYAPLPPGVAMNSQGMTYEIATGRPVYLQPTPPPLYDPRPIIAGHVPMHAGGVPFVPGHMHHHSHSAASPDYLAHTHTHSRTPSIPTFVDPLTGLPIFSLPRQNSRIEIRRPTEQLQHSSSKSPPGQTHRPSGLRTTVSALEAAAAQEEETTQQSQQSTDYYPSITDRPPDSAANGIHHPGMDPNVMAYQPYQPYYYPEYGYPTYVDPSQMQYDAYHEHHTPQPTIYY